MRQTEAIQYLPQRFLRPEVIVECAAGHCNQRVALANATAFPAKFKRRAENRFFLFRALLSHSSQPYVSAEGIRWGTIVNVMTVVANLASACAFEIFGMERDGSTCVSAL